MHKIVFSLILIVTPAAAQTPDTWNLMTKTQEGTVSLVKKLTKHECDFMLARALGRPATEEEKAADFALRAQQAEDAKAWQMAHHCDSSKGFSVNSSRSVAASDGSCSMGPEFGGITLKYVSAGDITSAECFQ